MGSLLVKDFHRILSDAVNFASTDVNLPMLRAVQLEAEEGNLIACATDRYVLGWSRADFEGDSLTALLPLDFVKQVIQMAKTEKYPSNRVEVTVTGRDVSVHFLNTRATLTARTVDAAFPRMRNLRPKPGQAPESESGKVARLNPKFLAKFAKVQGWEHGMAFLPHMSRPTLIRIGDNFQGMIMPVKHPDGFEPEHIYVDWL